MDIGRDLARAFDYGYEQGIKGATQWISVNDRLPDKENSLYLVWTSKNEALVASWNLVLGFICCYTVTHWMPLPEPPEGE